ncbi:MAG: glycosyltransferase [Richelia sp. RM2_1_2]|nr:glycosyltransferase [Richelia sp. RM2_1_2]
MATDRQISPPTLLEKFAYLKRNKNSLVGFGSASGSMLITGFLLYALSDYTLLICLPFIIFMAAYLTISYGLGMFSREFDHDRHRRIVDKHLSDAQEKSVDVYLPICGEDLDIIRNAWIYVKQLRWKHLNVYVLDDGRSDAAKELAAEFGFNYIRRDDNYMKKSGNLRNAFHQTSGEFILILDADFCARPEMLNEMVPYMLENPKLCIVQTPQYFESATWMNWVEKGAGEIQEFFYRYTQVSRNHWGGAICVGTSALYRREALDEIGGFRLKEWSEDVWNGFSMVDRGWQIEYVALNLSKGRCPETLRQLFNQQYRWACGSLSLAKNREFWGSSLIPMQKVCYVSGMMYFIFSAIIPFLILIPGPVAVWLFPEHVFVTNLSYYLPSLIYGTIVYKQWSHYKGFNLDFFIIRLFTYFVNLFALKDILLNTTMGWVATGAKAKKHINFQLYQVGALLLVTVNIAALVGGYLYHSETIDIVNLIPSFLSSAFYGSMFAFPIIRNLISERTCEKKKNLL